MLLYYCICYYIYMLLYVSVCYLICILYEPLWANQSLWGWQRVNMIQLGRPQAIEEEGWKGQTRPGQLDRISHVKVGQSAQTNTIRMVATPIGISGFGGRQQYQYHIFSGCSAIFLLYTYSSTCALLPSMFLLWFESCGHGPCWFFPLGSAQLFIPPDSPDAICVPNPDVSRMVSQLDEALYSKSTPQTCRECATTMSLAIRGMIFNLWPCFVEILWLTSGCMFQN